MFRRSLLPFLPTKTKLLQFIFGPIFEILERHYVSPSLIILIFGYSVFYIYIKTVVIKKKLSKGDTIYYSISLLIAMITITSNKAVSSGFTIGMRLK